MKQSIRPAIFKWRQTEPELILCAVRWYLRYSLSFRDVEELLRAGPGPAPSGGLTTNSRRTGRQSAIDTLFTRYASLVRNQLKQAAICLCLIVAVACGGGSSTPTAPTPTPTPAPTPAPTPTPAPPAPAPPASAQSRDDFAYWDANGNGDLTCTEAGPASAGGRDEGLRLPAYQDNRDGTGVIYEWLERSRSSDTDDDGIGCDSASNPNGYIPNVQVQPPVETQACSADAETWRGLKVCDERPRDGYDRDAFGTGYSSLEDEIIAALPPTMKANGQVYTPYSCLAFDITANGTAATDIEHIVALAETHDSGIADDRRRDIASDLDNLTIADPTVNRSEKSDRDAAEWMPARHGAWFVERVIQVKREYGLSVNPAERDALEALLAGGEAQLNCGVVE